MRSYRTACAARRAVAQRAALIAGIDKTSSGSILSTIVSPSRLTSIPTSSPSSLLPTLSTTTNFSALFSTSAPACAAPIKKNDSNTASSPAKSEDHGPLLRTRGTTLAGRALYLDAQATTPLDPRVLDAMLPFMTHQYGNPHSRTHHYGWETEDAVEYARGQIADLIGASPQEIIFTSGATESNNLAIKGIMRFLKAKKRHVITTQVEHKCVLDSCRALGQEGFAVTYLPVQRSGLLDLAELEKAIRPDTGLVTIMLVNNEIGTIQPLKEISEICKKHGIKLHTDAAQAVGKIPVDVETLGVDAMSISSHKLYGPKGMGALYVRRKPRVRLEPLFSGGGQERGFRSGTLAAPLVVGMGEACAIAKKELNNDSLHIRRLAERLYNGITSKLSHIYINGPPLDEPTQRYAGNLNLSFAYVEGESLLMGMKQVAVSSGSACTSASLEPSYVLRALGVGEDLAHTSIRFGIGRFTTEEEVDKTIDMAVTQVERLRDMSPLWEMVQEGIDLSNIQWTH